MQETQETWVQSLGWEDPLEKEMEAHSSVFWLGYHMDTRSWWIHSPQNHKRVEHDLATKQQQQ